MVKYSIFQKLFLKSLPLLLLASFLALLLALGGCTSNGYNSSSYSGSYYRSYYDDPFFYRGYYPYGGFLSYSHSIYRNPRYYHTHKHRPYKHKPHKHRPHKNKPHKHRPHKDKPVIDRHRDRNRDRNTRRNDRHSTDKSGPRKHGSSVHGDRDRPRHGVRNPDRVRNSDSKKLRDRNRPGLHPGRQGSLERKRLTADRYRHASVTSEIRSIRENRNNRFRHVNKRSNGRFEK